MTILLTGASGFLGSWIARALDPAPGELRVLARPTSDLTPLDGLAYDVAYGDLLDAASLARALEGVTHVIHSAGWISFKRRDAAKVREVNFEGTRNLFQAALAAGVEKVVYTASIFAFGHAEDAARPLDESARFNAHALLDMPYVRAKRDAEIAADAAIRMGLRLVRLYPGLALGPGDRARSSTGAVDAWLRGGVPALIAGGGICVADVRDIARAHVLALRHGQPGRKYLATGYNVTLPGLFDRLAERTGRRPPPLRLPPVPGVALAQLAEALGVFPALDGGQARLMARRWWYDSSRAERELDVRFRPLDETLADTVAWLQANPPVS